MSLMGMLLSGRWGPTGPSAAMGGGTTGLQDPLIPGEEALPSLLGGTP